MFFYYISLHHFLAYRNYIVNVQKLHQQPNKAHKAHDDTTNSSNKKF